VNRPVLEPFGRLQLLCLMLVVSLLGLTACQTLPTGGAPGRLADILESGELRVGLSGNQPPLNMRDKQGKIIGFEVDLINELATSMGLAVKLVPMPFSNLIGALERGEVDLVISGMTITPERNVRVAFAGPYFITGKSVLTKSEEIAGVEEPGQLDDSSRAYAALAGSTSESFVKAMLPRSRLVTTTDYDAAVDMVIRDEVDGLVADYQICMLSVWRNPDVELRTVMTPFTVEPLGIALPADAPLLVNLVENYLDTLDYTGQLTELKARWLGDGSWLADLP